MVWAAPPLSTIEMMLRGGEVMEKLAIRKKLWKVGTTLKAADRDVERVLMGKTKIREKNVVDYVISNSPVHALETALASHFDFGWADVIEISATMEQEEVLV